jgi:hypothetical protein
MSVILLMKKEKNKFEEQNSEAMFHPLNKIK